MAGKDTRVFVLLACLEPWLSALHRLCPPNDDTPERHTDSNGSRIVWFSGRRMFEVAAPSVESLDRVCEGLSLLALIAQADAELWKKIVLEVWTEDERLREWLEAEKLPKTLVVGLSLSEMRVGMIRNATMLLCDHVAIYNREAQPSPEYKDVREFLRKELSIQQDDDDTNANVRVRIELDDRMEHSSTMLRCVLNVATIEANGRQAIRESAECRPRFTVSNVDFSGGTNAGLYMNSLRILLELGQLGISLGQLPVLMMEPSPEELPEFIQALRDLVGLDDDRVAGVTTISINDHLSSWPVIRAVLTAAQHSSTVRTIELDVGKNEGDEEFREYLAGMHDYGEDDSEVEEHADDGGAGEDEEEAADQERVAVDAGEDVHGEDEENDVDGDEDEDEDADDEDDEDEDDEDEHEGDEEDYLDVLDRLNGRDSDHSQLWQWIAFTLFSRHADHNIETLELNSETLQDSEVEAIRRVLNAPNPYAVARGRPGVLPRPFVPRQITAARFTLQYPTPDAGPPFVAKNPIAVRVLETPDKGVFPWYQVLLPGYGDAFVHEDDVVSKSEDNLRLYNRQETPLPEFPRIDIVNMTDASMDQVAELIHLIGHGTRKIMYLEHLGEEGFQDWCGCVLESCPKLEELDMCGGFVDNLNVFEDSALEGECRLRSLIVSCAPTGDNALCARRFFNALSDPSHPLTEHLQELRLGLIVETGEPDSLLEPVLRMLAQNRQLLEIRLTFKFTEGIVSRRPEFESALDNRPSDDFVIRTGPLDLRCKLAFLSAVDVESRAQDSALSQLDSSVLSIVLQFAAEGRKRVCSVFYDEFSTRLP